MNFRDFILGGLIGWVLWITLYGGCQCASQRPLVSLGKLLLWLLGALL
jgi:hypothetical protein